MTTKTTEEIIAGHFATALDFIRNEVAEILDDRKSECEVLIKRIEALETELDELKTKRKGWFK